MRLFFSFLLLISAMTSVMAEQICKDTLYQTTPASRFHLQGDGTVIDSGTRLIWKLCTEGQEWVDGDCQGDAAILSWQQALQWAVTVNSGEEGQNMGYQDWRVPNIKELASIVEHACAEPALNLQVFPPIPGEWFWSASPRSDNAISAWCQSFAAGYDGHCRKTSSTYLRLVRGE